RSRTGPKALVRTPRRLLRRRAAASRPSGLLDGHQLERLIATGDIELLQFADALRIELLAQHVGLERRPLSGEQRTGERAIGHLHRRPDEENHEMVFRLAGEVFLCERLADLRVAGHVNARQCAFYTGLPRP